MTTLTKKLKEINKELKLEVKQAALAIKAKELEKKKLASDRAKLKAKLRIEEKKKEAANNKVILSNFKKYAKLINDNELLIGGLINVVNAINANDEAAIKRLNYFRGLVPKENN